MGDIADLLSGEAPPPAKKGSIKGLLEAPAAAPKSGAGPNESREPLRLTVRPTPTDERPLPKGAIRSTLEPLTSFWDTYNEFNQAAREQISKGAQQVVSPGEGESRLAGAVRMGLGGLQYGFSPIDAAIHSVAGRPIERATGLPAAITDFVIGVGVPMVHGATSVKARSLEPIKTIERILSPTTVDSNAELAEGLIRSEGGTAARQTAQAQQVFSSHAKIVNALSDVDKLGFIDKIETGQINTLRADLQPLATKMRAALDERWARLTALPKHAMAAFVDEYFPHMWKDPGNAQQAMRGWQAPGSGGKQGSGASLKARSVPTIADGIARGLEPISTDPIEIAMRYITSMDKFIASETVRDTALQTGMARWVKPTVMGASGNVNTFKAPPGWAPLRGRGATSANGSVLYAPEGFARVFNNFISRGIAESSEDLGNAYNMALRASNTITAMELGLSGYHVMTMAGEAGVSRLARGIDRIMTGAGAGDWRRMLRGLADYPAAFLAPISSAFRGREMQKVYLGTSPGTPDMARIVNLLEKAGGRAVGSSHAKDYQFSAMGSYWTAFQKGALGLQARDAMARIQARPIVGTGQVAAQQLGRIMQTVAQPIFDVYIPKVKNGAFYDTMASWLEHNPTASHAEQVKQARVIWDSIDNRFGEMVHDNIFWNQTLKQAAMLGMRSYSWNLGTVRELGGGAKDIAKGEWSPRAAYTIALPIWHGTMNAVYQYLKTGQGPQSVQDLVGGRTGGEQTMSIPRERGFGRSQQSTSEERVSLPGYMKDVFGWYDDWSREAINKVATGFRLPVDLAMNRDWRGDPIVNPESQAPEWLSGYFKYVLQALTPISGKNMMQGRKQGSNISTPESLMGLRPAPAYVSDPEGAARRKHSLNVISQRRKQNFEKKQERQYGGTE